MICFIKLNLTRSRAKIISLGTEVVYLRHTFSVGASEASYPLTYSASDLHESGSMQKPTGQACFVFSRKPVCMNCWPWPASALIPAGPTTLYHKINLDSCGTQTVRI